MLKGSERWDDVFHVGGGNTNEPSEATEMTRVVTMRVLPTSNMPSSSSVYSNLCLDGLEMEPT